MKSRLDIHLMMICAKYFNSFNDFINISNVHKNYHEISNMFHYNPVPIKKEDQESLFSNIETYVLDAYDPRNEIEQVKYVNYKRLEIPNNYIMHKFGNLYIYFHVCKDYVNIILIGRSNYNKLFSDFIEVLSDIIKYCRNNFKYSENINIDLSYLQTESLSNLFILYNDPLVKEAVNHIIMPTGLKKSILFEKFFSEHRLIYSVKPNYIINSQQINKDDYNGLSFYLRDMINYEFSTNVPNIKNIICIVEKIKLLLNLLSNCKNINFGKETLVDILRDIDEDGNNIQLMEPIVRIVGYKLNRYIEQYRRLFTINNVQYKDTDKEALEQLNSILDVLNLHIDNNTSIEIKPLTVTRIPKNEDNNYRIFNTDEDDEFIDIEDIEESTSNEDEYNEVMYEYNVNQFRTYESNNVSQVLTSNIIYYEYMDDINGPVMIKCIRIYNRPIINDSTLLYLDYNDPNFNTKIRRLINTFISFIGYFQLMMYKTYTGREMNDGFVDVEILVSVDVD